MSDKKMLMLGTSYGSCEMVKYAKSIGVYTIVTDYLPPERSVAKLEADEYWMINTGDIDTLEEQCRKSGVNAVCCGVSEFNLERTLDLCKRLGLKAYCTPEAWQYSRNKRDFKELCRKLQVPVAKDYYLTSELTEEELDKVEFPVVVKPVDLSANRGVSYCHNKKELRDAYKYARSISKCDEIIVEKMLHGEEWYGMYAIADGEIGFLALNEMYAQPGEPSNCYTITSTVSRHVERYCREINPKIEELLKEVGCTDGIAWVQVMLDKDDQFYIIEMGYRMDGVMMFIPYRKLLGFDAIQWIVETSLGIEHNKDQIPAPQTKAFSGTATAMALWTNKSGKIARIEGLSDMEKTEGVYVEMLSRPGEEISKYESVGVVTFSTENFEQMQKLIELVNDKIHVYNEKDEDVIIKYTDFEYLREIYQEGLKGE